MREVDTITSDDETVNFKPGLIKFNSIRADDLKRTGREKVF